MLDKQKYFNSNLHTKILTLASSVNMQVFTVSTFAIIYDTLSSYCLPAAHMVCGVALRVTNATLYGYSIFVLKGSQPIRFITCSNFSLMFASNMYTYPVIGSSILYSDLL